MHGVESFKITLLNVKIIEEYGMNCEQAETSVHKCTQPSTGRFWGEKILQPFIRQKFQQATSIACYLQHCRYINLIGLDTGYTRSVRKVSDRIFLCEHLMDYNLARLHEPTLNLSAHA
jgi:hypothetical protein